MMVYHIMRLIEVVNVAFALINIFKSRPFKISPKIPTSAWTAQVLVSLCFVLPTVKVFFGSTMEIFFLPEHKKSKRKKIIIFNVNPFISYKIMIENYIKCVVFISKKRYEREK